MAPKSEYRRKFVVDEGELKDNYKLLLDFRKCRKSHEYRHTPFVWETSDLEDDEDDKPSSSRSIIAKRRRSSRLKVLTENSENLCKTDKTVKRQKLDVTYNKDENQSISRRSHIDIGVQTPEKSRKLSSKRRSPRKKAHVRKALSPRAPLLAYGWADHESITKKKTFNTLAPKDQVHESALNAVKQREMRTRARQSRKERLALEKEKRQALIASLTKFDAWQTEYQKSFCK